MSFGMTAPSSGCAVIPYSSSAHHLVRGADFVFKLTSLIALAINFPLPCVKRKTLTMHSNLKVCFKTKRKIWSPPGTDPRPSIHPRYHAYRFKLAQNNGSELRSAGHPGHRLAGPGPGLNFSGLAGRRASLDLKNDEY